MFEWGNGCKLDYLQNFEATMHVKSNSTQDRFVISNEIWGEFLKGHRQRVCQRLKSDAF